MAKEINTTALLQQAKNGDMMAFETLVTQTEKMVYHTAYRMMNHSEDAKDITQDVFMKIYNYLEKFDEQSAFTTWVYRITVNTCIDEIRKRKGKQTFSMDAELEQENNSLQIQYADSSDTPEEVLTQKESYGEILTALDNLSTEHKTIITLRDLDGLSYATIGDITETSLGTVKSRLARARNQLKQEMKKIWEQNDSLPRHTKQKGGKCT